MKYKRNTQNLLRYCLLTAVLLLYQIVSLCAAETALNTTINKTIRYIVTVTDTNGCQGNDTATMNVALCESWRLVTDASELAVGDKIVIAAKDYNYGLAGQHNDYRDTAVIQKSSDGNTLEDIGNSQILTLTTVSPYILNTCNKNLYYSGSGNSINEQTEVNNKGKWNINFSGHEATIQNFSNSGRFLQYNPSSPRFVCYTSASNQKEVSIYKLYAPYSDTSITTCNNPFSIHERTFTESGCYRIELPGRAGNGCDSIIFLNLTIQTEIHGPDISHTSCGPYSWHGKIYNTTGNYNDTIITAAGCDSIVTLHLTVKEVPNVHISTNPANPIVCEGDSITLIGTTDCGGTEVILEEGFDGLSGNNNTDNGSATSINISQMPNFYSHENVYQAGNAIKIGKSKTVGKIISKELDLTQSYTVEIRAKGWVSTSSSTYTSIKVSATNCSSSWSFNVPCFANGSSSYFSNYQHYFDAATASPSRLTIETTGGDKRAFIDSVKITKNANCTSSFSSQSMGLLYTSINTTSDPISYNVTPQTTEWYHYSVEAPNGCVGKDSVQVVVSKPPELSIIASADTICAGEVDTLWIERVSSIAIGDILCTDNSFVKPVDWEDAAAMGKVALGIVFYVDNTGEHGWAVHLHNSTSPKRWTLSPYNTDIHPLFNYPNAREAIKDLDGYTNTQRIRSASNATPYPADIYPAVYAVDFEHGWYLPAAGQLRLLYAERHTINASLEAVSHTQQGVTPIADTFQYWSSTECNRDEAWGVTNSLGWVRNTSKNEYNRTCSVRNF